MDLRTPTFIAALTALALAVPAGALTIDNFSEGTVNVFDTTGSSGPTTQENSGLNDANTRGGVRFTVVAANSALGSPGTASASSGGGSVTLTATQQGAYSFFYDGMDDNVANTTDGSLFLNLNSGDRFTVDFTNTSAPDAEFRITLWDGDSISNTLFRDAVTGVNEILFSEFLSPIDFDDIRTIRLQIDSVLNAGSLVVNDFSTNAIPEPGTALLLGLGLVGLGARGRSRR